MVEEVEVSAADGAGEDHVDAVKDAYIQNYYTLNHIKHIIIL